VIPCLFSLGLIAEAVYSVSSEHGIQGICSGIAVREKRQDKKGGRELAIVLRQSTNCV
jgi:hypothetical protein